MRWGKLAAVTSAVVVVLASAPWVWTQVAAIGHRFDEVNAPTSEAVLVLGTEVVDGRPGQRLAGRLQTAAALVKAGRAQYVLVSGDGNGASGNETEAMKAYLADLGVYTVATDPYGLDTYDSCIRARDVYGVRRALVVTQAYHLSRAVTVCRQLGLEAEGVYARCPGCSRSLLAGKAARDYLASIKALWDTVTGRPPAV